jgi:hypothetical protein
MGMAIAAEDPPGSATVGWYSSYGTISYDASSATYLVEVSGKSHTFGDADSVSSATENERVFSRINRGRTEDLLLSTGARSGAFTLGNVGMARFRSEEDTGSVRYSEREYFLFGYPTAPSDAPLTGSVTFLTALAGTLSWYARPQDFYGEGLLGVDLRHGVFWAESSLESDDTSTTYVFNATGAVSGAGLTGKFVLGPPDSSGEKPVVGDFDGSYFGADAEELGATLTGTNGLFLNFVGTMTGRETTGDPWLNFQVDNLQTDHVYSSRATWLRATKNGDGTIDGQPITWSPQEFIETLSGDLGHSGASYQASDLADTSDPAFLIYTGDYYEVQRFKLYRRGADNGEVQLTYTGFGLSSYGYLTSTEEQAFVYGFETPNGLLVPRQGYATYNGVAYEAAVDEAASKVYDVTGTLLMNVNFDSDTLSGALGLAGALRGGAGNINFGDFTFNDSFDPQLSRFDVLLEKNGAAAGNFWAAFYGPEAEEVGGTFNIEMYQGVGSQGLSDYLTINGVAVGKR